MDKAHDVQSVKFVGKTMILKVDNETFKIDIARESRRLASATPKQRMNVEVSPSGYGLHWPDVDEDMSIDGLIGAVRKSPTTGSRHAGRR